MLKNGFLSVSVKAINFLREMGNFVSVLLQLQHLAQYLENNRHSDMQYNAGHCQKHMS